MEVQNKISQNVLSHYKRYWKYITEFVNETTNTEYK